MTSSPTPGAGDERDEKLYGDCDRAFQDAWVKSGYTKGVEAVMRLAFRAGRESFIDKCEKHGDYYWIHKSAIEREGAAE